MKLLNFRENFLLKEFVDGLRRDGMLHAVHGDVDAVDAVAHAEGAAELDFILEPLFLNERLKPLDDLAGTLEVARTSMQIITFI